MVWIWRWKPKVELNRFYKYDVHILGSQNAESGESELKNVVIIYDTIINARWNQVDDMIQGYTPSSRTVRKYHLDRFQPSLFLGINNITVPVKKGIRWYGWLAAEEKSCKNASINYFNDSIDNIILDHKGNICGIIDIPSIESSFVTDRIHVLHDLSKRYI